MEIGKRTKGKDGIVYRSKFEADFSNKFLLPLNLKYTYEKKYPDSNYLCDFYIDNYDLWIECVYGNVFKIYRYQTLTDPFGFIHGIKIPFKVKHLAKRYKGAHWNNKHGGWSIHSEGAELRDLHPYLESNKTKEGLSFMDRVWYCEGGVSDDYKKRLGKKLDCIDSRRDEAIAVACKKYCDKYDNLYQVFSRSGQDWVLGIINKDKLIPAGE